MRIYTKFTPEQKRAAFFKKVAKTHDGCWNWKGAVFVQGYGVVCDDGRKQKAHRFSYEIHHGPIPPGMFVLHKCDNKLCVNPLHLECGTQAKNVKDAWSRGLISPRQGERHPRAKLSPEDVAAIRTAKTSRGYALALSQNLGVSKDTIFSVRARKTWRHIP